MRRVFCLLLLAVLTGCSSSPSVSVPAPHGHGPTVFIIVMENHDWSAIKGSASAPYINHVLLPKASYATRYYNPPGIHPSLPNYLWLMAGANCFSDTGCIRSDGDPSQYATHSPHNLGHLLNDAHVSWRAYEEDISGNTCPLHTNVVLQVAAENGIAGSSYLYAARHDPFVYFDDLTGDQNPYSMQCIHHIRPFTSLSRDLKHNTVARFNFITPNVCNDMHSPCPALSDPIRQGDSWLSHVVPLIMHSRAYTHGVLFITWDEGESNDGPIGMIVLSPFAKRHGYHNAIYYTHSSTLRTIEEILGVRPFLGGAARAHDLRGLFRQLP